MNNIIIKTLIFIDKMMVKILSNEKTPFSIKKRIINYREKIVETTCNVNYQILKDKRQYHHERTF